MWFEMSEDKRWPFAGTSERVWSGEPDHPGKSPSNSASQGSALTTPQRQNHHRGQSTRTSKQVSDTGPGPTGLAHFSRENYQQGAFSLYADRQLLSPGGGSSSQDAPLNLSRAAPSKASRSTASTSPGAHSGSSSAASTSARRPHSGNSSSAAMNAATSAVPSSFLTSLASQWAASPTSPGWMAPAMSSPGSRPSYTSSINPTSSSSIFSDQYLPQHRRLSPSSSSSLSTPAALHTASSVSSSDSRHGHSAVGGMERGFLVPKVGSKVIESGKRGEGKKPGIPVGIAVARQRHDSSTGSSSPRRQGTRESQQIPSTDNGGTAGSETGSGEGSGTSIHHPKPIGPSTPLFPFGFSAAAAAAAAFQHSAPASPFGAPPQSPLFPFGDYLSLIAMGRHDPTTPEYLPGYHPMFPYQHAAASAAAAAAFLSPTSPGPPSFPLSISIPQQSSSSSSSAGSRAPMGSSSSSSRSQKKTPRSSQSHKKESPSASSNERAKKQSSSKQPTHSNTEKKITKYAIPTVPSPSKASSVTPPSKPAFPPHQSTAEAAECSITQSAPHSLNTNKASKHEDMLLHRRVETIAQTPNPAAVSFSIKRDSEEVINVDDDNSADEDTAATESVSVIAVSPLTASTSRIAADTSPSLPVAAVPPPELTLQSPVSSHVSSPSSPIKDCDSLFPSMESTKVETFLKPEIKPTPKPEFLSKPLPQVDHPLGVGDNHGDQVPLPMSSGYPQSIGKNLLVTCGDPPPKISIKYDYHKYPVSADPSFICQLEAAANLRMSALNRLKSDWTKKVSSLGECEEKEIESRPTRLLSVTQKQASPASSQKNQALLKIHRPDLKSTAAKKSRKESQKTTRLRQLKAMKKRMTNVARVGGAHKRASASSTISSVASTSQRSSKTSLLLSLPNKGKVKRKGTDTSSSSEEEDSEEESDVDEFINKKRRTSQSLQDSSSSDTNNNTQRETTTRVASRTPRAALPVCMPLIEADLHLKEGQSLALLLFQDSVFLEATASVLIPDNAYNVEVCGVSRRERQAQVFAHADLLIAGYRDRGPVSNPRDISVGARVCVYWSEMFTCMYVATVRGIVQLKDGGAAADVECDDEDRGVIPLHRLRLIPSDFPETRCRESSVVHAFRKPLSSASMISPGSYASLGSPSSFGLTGVNRKNSSTLEKEPLPKPTPPKESVAVKGVDSEKKAVVKGLGRGRRPRLLSVQQAGSGDDRISHNTSTSDDEEESEGMAMRPSQNPQAKGKKDGCVQFTHGNDTMKIGDCAVFHPGPGEKPYVGQIYDIWKTRGRGIGYELHIRWFYHPSEIKLEPGVMKNFEKGALLESSHEDTINSRCILHKCNVDPCRRFRVRKAAGEFKGPEIGVKNYYIAGMYDCFKSELSEIYC